MSALRSTSQVKQINMGDKQNRKASTQAEIEEIILKILSNKKSVPTGELTIVEGEKKNSSLFLHLLEVLIERYPNARRIQSN